MIKRKKSDAEFVAAYSLSKRKKKLTHRVLSSALALALSLSLSLSVSLSPLKGEQPHPRDARKPRAFTPVSCRKVLIQVPPGLQRVTYHQKVTPPPEPPVSQEALS